MRHGRHAKTREGRGGARGGTREQRRQRDRGVASEDLTDRLAEEQLAADPVGGRGHDEQLGTISVVVVERRRGVGCIARLRRHVLPRATKHEHRPQLVHQRDAQRTQRRPDRLGAQRARWRRELRISEARLNFDDVMTEYISKSSLKMLLLIITIDFY